MSNMDWLPDLRDDSHIDKWCDAAVQIEFRYRNVLQYFNSDVASFQAYLHRVAQLGVINHEVDEGFDEAGEAFKELVDTYPLDPKFFKDSDRVLNRPEFLRHLRASRSTAFHN